MQLSKSIKRAIYWELGIPLALLSIGIYHGLMQVIYRAGGTERYRVKVKKGSLQKKYLYFNEEGRLLEESMTL